MPRKLMGEAVVRAKLYDDGSVSVCVCVQEDGVSKPILTVDDHECQDENSALEDVLVIFERARHRFKTLLLYWSLLRRDAELKKLKKVA